MTGADLSKVTPQSGNKESFGYKAKVVRNILRFWWILMFLWLTCFSFILFVDKNNEYDCGQFHIYSVRYIEDCCDVAFLK